MQTNTELMTNAADLDKSMTDVSEIMADLSASMDEAADGFAAFEDSTSDLTAARTQSGGFAAADD